MRSEVYSQGKLNDSRIIKGAPRIPECAAIDVAGRRREVRVVGYVEEVRLERGLQPLRDLELLGQAESEFGEVRSHECVAAQ